MNADPSFSAEDISRMLAVIPPRPDYGTWLRIVSAVYSALPLAEGARVLQAWSPEQQEGEYVAKHKARLNQVTIGTLVHLAKQHGHTPRGGHRGRVRVVSSAAIPTLKSVTSGRLPMPDYLTGKPSPPITTHLALERPQAARPTSPRPQAPRHRPAPIQVPDGYCAICWSRWARALRPDCCVCSAPHFLREPEHTRP